MGDMGREVLACIIIIIIIIIIKFVHEGVLPTGPIRISYNKFRNYTENRHLLHHSLTVSTISRQRTYLFQFAFLLSTIEQLHVWCVSDNSKACQLVQHVLPGFAI